MGAGSRLLTLIGGLRRLGDIHSQLSTEGIHAHHSRVDRSVSEGRELAVVAGDAVQGLCDVGRSLQNYLLKRRRTTPLAAPLAAPFVSCTLPAAALQAPGAPGLPWLTDCLNVHTPLCKPWGSVPSSSHA